MTRNKELTSHTSGGISLCITGVTSRAIIVDDISPPMITHASEALRGKCDLRNHPNLNFRRAFGIVTNAPR